MSSPPGPSAGCRGLLSCVLGRGPVHPQFVAETLCLSHQPEIVWAHEEKIFALLSI